MMTKRIVIPDATIRSEKVVPLFSNITPRTEYAQEDDALLLGRISDQDHAAFAVLVQRHTPRFYRVAYRFLRHASEAEDIVQEAFLKLWERPGQFEPARGAAFTTWFYRIVVNQCLDFSRKRRPSQLVDDSWIEDDQPNHEENLLEGEKQRMLEQHIAGLPERQRVALNLCFYEGLSNRQAADIMGVRLKALQALLMRAKATLKEGLKFMAGGPYG